MWLRDFSLVLFAALLVQGARAEAALSIDPGARVSFTALGPAGMKIVGSTSELVASDDGGTITVTVTLAHLATGIELRDKHMREKYLEVQTFPTAVLTVPRGSLSFPLPGATQSGDASGTLTLHGHARPSTFHYSAANDGSRYRVDATTHVDMRDFGITVPSYLGLRVKPDVDIDVHFTAIER